MEQQELDPGPYSVFVLLEDGFWEQPIYRIEGEGWTEAKLEAAAMNEYVSQDPIYVCGVCRDDDAPEDCIENLGECP